MVGPIEFVITEFDCTYFDILLLSDFLVLFLYRLNIKWTVYCYHKCNYCFICIWYTPHSTSKQSHNLSSQPEKVTTLAY